MECQKSEQPENNQTAAIIPSMFSSPSFLNARTTVVSSAALCPFASGEHFTGSSLLTEKRYFCPVVHTLAF